ncbi:MAG: amidohydrolase family protein [Candidatus Binatia bacterium]
MTQEHTGVLTKGAIDADGHILEPPDLWERYLEPKYRDRAFRLRTNSEGLEVFEIDGKRMWACYPGFPGQLGGMGAANIDPSPERTYVGSAPFGSMDAKERVTRLDREGLAKAILYPTLGLFLGEVTDPELSAAHCRAYNRWIVDFCSDSGGRLIPIAQVSLDDDPHDAARELERAVKAGAKGGFFLPFSWKRKSPGHPDYDPLWAKAQELDVPLSIHPTADPPALDVHKRFTDLAQGDTFNFTWYMDVLVAQGMMQSFVSLFHYGLFDRFPKVKMVVLESQAGWIGYLLDRMDAVYKVPLGKTTGMKESPSTYFRRQCWISADPDEKTVTTVIQAVGSDRFFWASDFPHPDHISHYMQALGEMVAPLPEAARQQVLWENVSQVYNLGE